MSLDFDNPEASLLKSEAFICEPALIYSPARDAVQPEEKIIHVELKSENEYNGKPNPSNDAAWTRLFKNANIRLKPHELEKTKRTSVKLSDGSGDFYGTLDVYHQLHCVRYIREYVHSEYYNLKATPVSNMDHVDHCIDMLRQIVMCRGDIALTTYKWIPNYSLPWPDFGLAHECRNWERIDNWASKRAIDVNDYSLIVHPELGPAFLEPDWNRTKGGA
ncbi:tat pathway signal sequence protein [Penicillium digitatum]|uniref:Tat pathway signal sequence protein n=1 Tax=Penicillium digitatum TaxID=36651 RepID=A0A7T7BNL8_PENDI|nr:tat pathway signal sequence protein [Penicillium digitatum]